MKDYSPLADSARVSAVDYDPIVVTEQSVARKLREVSTSRASGPDDIPNWVLKEYADILVVPIAVILNASFSEVSVPRVWKLADVPPLPKAPIVSDFNKDLRPISLTSTMSKIAESCKEQQSCFTRSPPTHSPVELDGLAFESVNSAKVLGVTIRYDFKWNDHIFNVTSKAAKRLYLLSQLKRAGICESDLVLFYCSTIRSVFRIRMSSISLQSSVLFIRGAGTYSEARLAHYLSLCKLQQRAQRGRHPLSL